ncbi:MAG: dihydrolipoyl dehydrogenase [Planctomycetia bacterium]
MNHTHDLIVVGGGPAGYVAALRAAQLGFNVACVERESLLGGTCLRVGCIPSKALLESSELYTEAKHKFADHGIRLPQVELDLAVMQKRRADAVVGLAGGIGELLKARKVARYFGTGRFVGPNQLVVDGADEPTTLTAKHVIVATGSKSLSLPGVELDYDRVCTSTEALTFDAVPESLIVIGAGAIGLELGSVWSRLGAKVTVLEYLDRILPEMDEEIANDALRVFKKQGLEFKLGTRVTGAKSEGGRAVVHCEGMEPQYAERVLMAVGRGPNTEGLGLEVLGVALDKRGRIPVDEQYRTSAPGVYAVGDVIAGPMLAHKAEEEGVACVEFIATGYGHVNYDAIPAVVYTHPEVAGVGKTEQQLKKEEIPYRKGVFPFRANGRARIIGALDGKVKMLAHAETDRILGVHILGARAGDLIAEAVVAMEFGASAEDVARCSHAHPTMPEMLKEAALAVDKRPLHVV